MIRKLILSLILLAAFGGPVLADGTSSMAALASANASIRVVVPVRDIARGEVLVQSDLTFGTTTGNAMMNGIVTSMDGALGLEARRVLHAGQTLSAADLRRPVVVNKGETVTMTFDAPGVELTAMGRAMGEGGIGDTVTVQNPSSFRMINGVITAPGTVIATGPASPISAQRTARN
jgi:flagella basal body P-ring formation protein FlgA